ncbi:GAF domain-containing protein (plasmid) [Streptomyces sp. CA-294286]|uniref:GAF domain-containing protein n=1 Tax=Streptomyces sp. CA-294286 TaxID=3240070 RepID=UPI003D8C6A6D
MINKVLEAAEGTPDTLPARLCAVLVDHLPVRAASLTLLPHTRARQLIAASDAEALRVEELQFETAEGPCTAAADIGEPVLVADLEHQVTPWPVFGALMREQLPGVAALWALPLSFEGQTLGSAELLFGQPAPADPALLARAQEGTTAVTAILLHAYGLLSDDETPAPWEQAPLVRTHWASTHRAAGALSENLDIGTDEALARLRAHAFAANQPLPHLAAHILTTDRHT